MSPCPAPIGAADLDWVHALNQTHATELSSLDRAEMTALIAGAHYARQCEGGAFLIGFSETAAYDSPCYLWHQARFDRFLYIDRVAVAATHRRRGLARRLYEDAFAYAREAGYLRVLCEVNSDPPNPGSDAFHAALGFDVVGEETLAERGKTVRFMARMLDK